MYHEIINRLLAVYYFLAALDRIELYRKAEFRFEARTHRGEDLAIRSQFLRQQLRKTHLQSVRILTAKLFAPGYYLGTNFRRKK